MNRFQEKLKLAGFRLTKGPIEILQVNLGKLCNSACLHCHVEAGPAKTRENMDRRTAETVLAYLKDSGIRMLDLTGGAPELNPNFRRLVTSARKLGIHVIDRSNLTVFYEPGMSAMPDFLASHEVEITASLPCYRRENADKQRGRGTFDKSIEALLWLNRLGYGKAGADLPLNLVYNPAGPHLPPNQQELEKDYHERLREDFGIVFNHLYTITNMPITRYAKYLKVLNQYEAYRELLIRSFNSATLGGLMCRNTLSVGWNGKLYDCDFNQMLGMEIASRDGKPITIFDSVGTETGTSRVASLEGLEILFGDHCFGCTAGRGSSCRGALRYENAEAKV